MPLTDLACRKSKPGPKLYKLSDMGGLQLWVFPYGSKLWRLAYRFGGKQKLISLGKYPETSLLQARAEREKSRALLRERRDPSHARKIARIEQENRDDSFQAVAREYLNKLRTEGRAETTLTKVEWLLEFAMPILGPLTVSAIRPIEVLAVLRQVERRGRYETARRLRSTIGAVCRYAIATARAQSDPTISLQGALITPKVKSRAAILDARAFGALLRAMDGFDGQPTTFAALKLMALLFPRPGELRCAGWSEFDFEAAVWMMPAARTKMRRSHKVPLSPQAIKVLRDLHSSTGSGEFLLPSVRGPRRPIAENTMNAALRRLGYSQDEMTAHGFRATASTLLNESRMWSADAIELQLGHIENNDARRAYARGEHWDERVAMMRWWANRLDELRQAGAATFERRSA